MKYFLMSMKFNKQSPSDFGLEIVNGKFVSSKDGSEWVQCQLYDYGWGKENGYYKKPLGSFEELIKIVLDFIDEEDSYGAASIIEDIYPNELKQFLLDLMHHQPSSKIKIRLCSLFKLNFSINRTFNKDYSFENNEIEYQEWKKIGEFYSK